MPIPLLRLRTRLLRLLRAVTKPMPDYCLVVMRLTDMHVVHPGQDNTRSCSQCGHIVGIYPSGQKALKRYPQAKIVCARCVEPGAFDVTQPAAENVAEYVAEKLASRPPRP